MRACVVLSGDGWTRESVFEYGHCHRGVLQSGGSCVVIIGPTDVVLESFMFAMECATNCTNVAAARLMSKLLTMNSGYRSWYRANFIAVWYARQAIPKRSLRYI